MTPAAPGHVKFTCRHCGQHIEAPVEYGGTFVPCPTCGETVLVPESAPAAPPPPSPQRTQRIHMPSAIPPPPKKPLPPPSRPAPSTPASAIPPTPVLDAYLLPVLFILCGVVIGIVFGDSPAALPWVALLSLLVFVTLLGHLGAIASRLKTIEALLRAPRP